MKITYEKVRDVKDPVFSDGNAGIDLFIPNDTELLFMSAKNEAAMDLIKFEHNSFVVLEPGDSVKIPAGLKFDIPDGWALDLLNKSGVALNGLTVGAELIDSSYTGEINFHLLAHRTVKIEAGQKITQAVIIKDYVPELELIEGTVDKETSRGHGGFGSTGTK